MGGANGKQWVMLVAGSNTWDNYRHQADVCHAYQIVHQNGIPDEQIVVMMYDDIAYNKKNPYPGNIINKPNGPNVYPGVLKDYTGEVMFFCQTRNRYFHPYLSTILTVLQDVTPGNFLAALKGDSSAVKKTNPKVIASGGYDTIFIYLSDHGGPSTFSFPNGTLYAHDLIETIKEMARNNKFSKMVIYMESCFSGSMLATLPDNVHVYAVTAARADESSYACFLDPVRKTFLSDKFSALWMHYIQVNDLNKKTFRDQFSYLQEKMRRSHSCRFGDMTVGEHLMSVFVNNTPQRVQDETRAEGLALTHLTSNHEVPFKILEHRIKTETDEDKRQHLIRKHAALHQTKARIEGTVKAISQHFPGFEHGGDLDEDYSQMDLHAFKTVAEHFRTTCFDWHEEEFQMALSHTHVFARLCARGAEAERIIKVITAVSRKKRLLQY
ncbi:legumain-like isoform X1 [Onychostoma macrolepis]|uniref:legumain-like isoform X1 n=1 Tax=Onychostoma macrolepis TaxID=369639 RepID=UPI002729A557|nr:legumain-like isoform X1 [Onychostoma macrolepis]